jgi:hypothetical protein
MYRKGASNVHGRTYAQMEVVWRAPTRAGTHSSVCIRVVL